MSAEDAHNPVSADASAEPVGVVAANPADESLDSATNEAGPSVVQSDPVDLGEPVAVIAEHAIATIDDAAASAEVVQALLVDAAIHTTDAPSGIVSSMSPVEDTPFSATTSEPVAGHPSTDADVVAALEAAAAEVDSLQSQVDAAISTTTEAAVVESEARTTAGASAEPVLNESAESSTQPPAPEPVSTDDASQESPTLASASSGKIPVGAASAMEPTQQLDSAPAASAAPTLFGTTDLAGGTPASTATDASETAQASVAPVPAAVEPAASEPADAETLAEAHVKVADEEVHADFADVGEILAKERAKNAPPDGQPPSETGYASSADRPADGTEPRTVADLDAAIAAQAAQELDSETHDTDVAIAEVASATPVGTASPGSATNVVPAAPRPDHPAASSDSSSHRCTPSASTASGTSGHSAHNAQAAPQVATAQSPSAPGSSKEVSPSAAIKPPKAKQLHEAFTAMRAKAAKALKPAAEKALAPVVTKYAALPVGVRKGIAIVAVGTAIQAGFMWTHLLFIRSISEEDALAAGAHGPIKGIHLDGDHGHDSHADHSHDTGHDAHEAEDHDAKPHVPAHDAAQDDHHAPTGQDSHAEDAARSAQHAHSAPAHAEKPTASQSNHGHKPDH